MKFLLQNKLNAHVFIQPPIKRIITYHSKFLGNGRPKPTQFFLSFPSTIFFYYSLLYFNETQPIPIFKPTLYFAFFNPDLNKIYHPALPNIAFSCNTCLGSFFLTNPLQNELNAKKIINYFWSTTFNDEIELGSLHLYKNFPHSNQIFHSNTQKFKNWQNKTKENPLWIPNHTEMIEIQNPSLIDLFLKEKEENSNANIPNPTNN